MSEIKYAPIPKWVELTGVNRTATYAALGEGHLRAIKVGRRTLIDVPHGLTWLASLPAALISPQKNTSQNNKAA